MNKYFQNTFIVKVLFIVSVFLLFSSVSFSQTVILKESFDNAIYTSPPALNWTKLVTAGSPTQHWSRATTSSRPPSINPNSGTGLAFINCYNNQVGNDEALITPVLDLSKTSGNTVSFWFLRHDYDLTDGSGSHLKVYVNTTQSLTGATLLIDLNTATATSPTVSTPGWYQYTYTIPSSYSGSINYILFNSQSDYWNNLHFDDVLIQGTGASAPPLVGFAYDITTDTVWVNSPYTFVNNSNGIKTAYWDITGYSSTINGIYTTYANSRFCATRWNTCYIDTLDQNLTWKFNQVGYYKLKLKAGNEFGTDSLTKIIVVAHPTHKPSASFFSANRSVGFTDQLNYYDLSANGPTAWNWFLNPTYYGVNTYSSIVGLTNTFTDPLTGNTLAANDTVTQNPFLWALDGGVFDVCLAVGNSLGWDTLCRQNYLTVNNGYMMCNGNDSVSFLSSGYVYDQNGPTGNYTGLTTGTCDAGFRIAACADTVILNIERFRLAAGDSITIRVGSPYGRIIKKLGGLSLQDSLKHYKVPGGSVFFQMNASNSSPGDSGFAIHWTTVPPSFGKPKGSFSFTTDGPTTNGIPSVYKGYTIHYTSTSTGVNMGYSWDTNGDGIFGTSIGGDSINATPSWSPTTAGIYTVCLKVYNCVGQDSVCKKVRVLPLTNKPAADMTVNKYSGFTTDTFRFYDNSSNGAIAWQWSFNPTSVTYLNGTNYTSQNPIVFLNSAICYTVTLRATNALGNNTKIISCMVNVLGYNSPGTQYTIPAGSDVGISRVALGEIDTSTALQSPVYSQMNDLQKAILYRGVDYTVTTYRQTNNDPMTTRVWIDFNMNANFRDAGETIIDEKSQHKITTSKKFRMPDSNPTGNARMRVGITYDSTTLTPDMAQLGCFEDYGIYVGIDYVKPVLSLIGPSIYKMQVGKTYVELGVTATDNLEGDISSKYTRTGYLDVNTVGYYTLTYTVADLYGNISTPVQRVVQVEVNQTGPTISLNGKDTVIVGVNYTYSELGAIALDNVGKNISSLIAVTNNLNTSILGIDSVIYSITDAFGFTAKVKRIVLVVDTTAPIIVSLNGKTITDTVRYQIGTSFDYTNLVWATDNYDGRDQLTQTGSINVNVKGYYTLRFDATDASGNRANSFRLVVKIDNTILPTISLIGLSDITVDVNTVFVEPGINYNSDYYLTSLLVVSTTSNLDMTKLGTNIIKYCVSDPSNNTSCVSRTVHVVDRTAPVITLIGDDPYTLPRYHKYVDPGYSISDNYYTEAVLNNFFKKDESKVKNDVPGMYFVTYNVTDPSLNIAKTVRRTVFVEDKFEGIDAPSSTPKMEIYPNPNNGQFTIKLDNKTTVQTVKVYSIIGSLIKVIPVSATTNNMDVDMRDVTDGIYIIKLENESGSFTQKINIIK
jgi:PKD repeat protein